MRVEDGAGVGKAVDVLVSARRDDDLGDGVIEVVGIVADGVLFGLIEPDDDRAVVLVGVRGHDDRDDLTEEVVTLLDLGRIAGETLVTAGEGGVHVVELVGCNPVVFRHGRHWRGL